MSDRSDFPVHACFAIALAAILALKWFLYFGSPVTGTGITPARIGATVGHLIIWTLSYHFVLRARARGMLAPLAFFTLTLGVLTLPIFGWAGVAAMYWIVRKEGAPVETVAS